MPVGRRCHALNFLHSAAWVPPGGTQIGEYLIHYTTGAQMSVPIVSGENIADWWFGLGQPRSLNSSTIAAWTGSNPDSEKIGAGIALYKFKWVNPMPGLEISSIDFKSAMTASAPFLIAITAE
jgi:hypothetical protein